MGKIINYGVTLYPAKREGGFIATSFEFGLIDKYPKQRFEADSVKAMLDKVKAFAETHGKPCNASVRCLAPRKPAGFDRATHSLYFNLDKANAA